MNTFVKAFVLTTAFAAPTVFAQTQAAQAPAKPAAEVKYKTPELHKAQIDEWLAKPDKVLFLDIRRPDELITFGSFPVFLNIQLADLEKNIAFIPKDRAIITVSNHANRAFKAGDLLSSKGFNVVGAAGSENYEQEGGTFVKKIVKPEPKPDAAKPEAPKK
jgi:rhodanese-related sulfurtransferase